MIRDFLHFLRHAFELLHFVRGVLGGLLLVLALCALVLMAAEDLALGEALYVTAITGLTVGYGDIVPTTTVGRSVSVVMGFVGVICVGIVVAIATRALAQAVEEKKRHEASPGDEGHVMRGGARRRFDQCR
jgi:Trk-type K+ transport system membrane component